MLRWHLAITCVLMKSPNKNDGPTSFRGPANWFSLIAPEGLKLEQTEAFLEVKPIEAQRTSAQENDRSRQGYPWSMTLYAAWVDAELPATRAASFDPTGLFPDIVCMQQAEPLDLPGECRTWTGISRQKAATFWARLVGRRRTYAWRLWIVEHKEIIVVATLQSAAGLALGQDAIDMCTATLSSISFAETLAKPPELFREDVLKLARKHYPLLDIESSGAFGLNVSGSEINLGNFYRSYIHDPNRLQQIVLPGLTTVVRLQELGPEQLMPPLEDIADRVMPMLYSEEEANAHLDGFVRVDWVGGLSIMFVLDEDETYRFVHERMLESWGISADDLRRIAMQNLETYTQENPLEVTLVGEEDDPRLLVPVEPHAYNSVRLLGEHLHQRLRQLLGPELVVGIPNRDFFVAVSLSHPGLIGQVRQRVAQDYQAMHHPLTSRLLVISADGVSEYCES